MGFDDMLFDAGIEREILELLGSSMICCKYVFDEHWDGTIDGAQLTEWESEMVYNGYSHLFHTLLPRCI